MSNDKKNTHNQITGKESKEQTTVGVNKNKPTTVDPSRKERVPNEKVPNIGDPTRKPRNEDSNAKRVPIKDERSEPRKEDKERIQHDQVTNADIKITNQRESDKKFNGK